MLRSISLCVPAQTVMAVPRLDPPSCAGSPPLCMARQSERFTCNFLPLSSDIKTFTWLTKYSERQSCKHSFFQQIRLVGRIQVESLSSCGVKQSIGTPGEFFFFVQRKVFKCRDSLRHVWESGVPRKVMLDSNIYASASKPIPNTDPRDPVGRNDHAYFFFFLSFYLAHLATFVHLHLWYYCRRCSSSL